MSREKMLQAEIALKDEQLADLNAQIESLRLKANELEKRAASVENEEQIATLKQAVGKLAPAAKAAAQYAAELERARNTLIVLEKDRDRLSEDFSVAEERAATLENALVEAQSEARKLKAKREDMAGQAEIAKKAARRNLTAFAAATVLCVGAIGGSYVYVKTSLDAPPELSAEAAAIFKRHAAEFGAAIERRTQNERERLNAERAQLAAERNRYQEWNQNTVWDNIVSYGKLALIFFGGLVVGATIVFAFFLSFIR